MVRSGPAHVICEICCDFWSQTNNIAIHFQKVQIRVHMELERKKKYQIMIRRLDGSVMEKQSEHTSDISYLCTGRVAVNPPGKKKNFVFF